MKEQIEQQERFGPFGGAGFDWNAPADPVLDKGDFNKEGLDLVVTGSIPSDQICGYIDNSIDWTSDEVMDKEQFMNKAVLYAKKETGDFSPITRREALIAYTAFRFGVFYEQDKVEVGLLGF